VVDILVNNAGVGLLGKFAELGVEAQAGMLRLNVESPTLLARLLLPSMLERGSGRILNLASTAAFQPGPLMAVYYATKAYVLSFSQALSNEVAGTGVTVTALCPGATETGFSSHAGSEQSRLFKGKVMDARTVAEAGYAGLMAGKPVVIPGARNRILALGARLGPRRLVTQVARRMQES
jgi:short-subunit dehydrogenase